MTTIKIIKVIKQKKKERKYNNTLSGWFTSLNILQYVVLLNISYRCFILLLGHRDHHFKEATLNKRS